MTPEEFRAAAHELVDWIADHRSRIPTLPVQAQVKPKVRMQAQMKVQLPVPVLPGVGSELSVAR